MITIPPGDGVRIESPLEQWHRIVLSQDAGAVCGLLAEDTIFYSPVAYTPQRGREAAGRYLRAALRVFFNPSFRCVRKMTGPRDGLFEFETEIDGILVNAIDLLRWNGEGRVVEFKVMVRPLRAISLTQQRMAAMLESEQAGAPRRSNAHIGL